MRTHRAHRASALRCAGALLALGGAALQGPPEVAGQEDRIDVEGLGWAAGPADAPIQVVEFTDPACPYCARFHEESRDSLFRDFVEPGHARWITVPWVSGLFPNSHLVAAALGCVGEERSEALLLALYRTQSTWVRAGGGEARRVVLREAERLGHPADALGPCMDAADTERSVERARRLGTELGVRGTPTYFVNGFPMMGALPYGFVRRVFDEALREAPAPGR